MCKPWSHHFNLRHVLTLEWPVRQDSGMSVERPFTGAVEHLNAAFEITAASFAREIAGTSENMRRKQINRGIGRVHTGDTLAYHFPFAEHHELNIVRYLPGFHLPLGETHSETVRELVHIRAGQQKVG